MAQQEAGDEKCCECSRPNSRSLGFFSTALSHYRIARSHYRTTLLHCIVTLSTYSRCSIGMAALLMHLECLLDVLP